jgi:adenine-specific DNA-methyltransferase
VSIYIGKRPTKSRLFCDGLADNIKGGRIAENLLFQVPLDPGIPLSSRIKAKEVGGKTAYYVNDGYLLLALRALTTRR